MNIKFPKILKQTCPKNMKLPKILTQNCPNSMKLPEILMRNRHFKTKRGGQCPPRPPPPTSLDKPMNTIIRFGSIIGGQVNGKR